MSHYGAIDLDRPVGQSRIRGLRGTRPFDSADRCGDPCVAGRR